MVPGGPNCHGGGGGGGGATGNSTGGTLLTLVDLVVLESKYLVSQAG